MVATNRGVRSTLTVPLHLSLCWMSLRTSWPCHVPVCLWGSPLRGSGMGVCGGFWATEVSFPWVRVRQKGWPWARAVGRGCPSRWPGPRCSAGPGCGGSHQCPGPPPAAWYGEAPPGYGSPPAEQEKRLINNDNTHKFSMCYKGAVQGIIHSHSLSHMFSSHIHKFSLIHTYIVCERAKVNYVLCGPS